MNSIQRAGKLTLDDKGVLRGEVKEVRLGDRASEERRRLRNVTKNEDRIKPIESILAGSLSSFQIVRASLINVDRTDLPFGFNYSFESDHYAKDAGNLLLVRPRVLGSKLPLCGLPDRGSRSLPRGRWPALGRYALASDRRRW